MTAPDAGLVHMLLMNGSLPRLYIPYPQCGHCGEDVTIDDGCAWCDHCLIQWDHIEDDYLARPDEIRDGTDVACQIVVGEQDEPHDDKRGNHYVPGPPKGCILPSGHQGEHLCPYDVEVTHTDGPA